MNIYDRRGEIKEEEQYFMHNYKELDEKVDEMKMRK